MRLIRWFRLQASERRLFRAACVALLRVRWGLSTRTFEQLHRELRRDARREGSGARFDPDAVCTAVQRAARVVPASATCLPQALAAEYLLIRNGWPAQLCIGAARSDERGFEAHAWVELERRIVIGGELRERFTSLQGPPA